MKRTIRQIYEQLHGNAFETQMTQENFMKGTSHQYNTQDPDELLGEFHQAFKEEEEYNFIPMFSKKGKFSN